MNDMNIDHFLSETQNLINRYSNDATVKQNKVEPQKNAEFVDQLKDLGESLAKHYSDLKPGEVVDIHKAHAALQLMESARKMCRTIGPTQLALYRRTVVPVVDRITAILRRKNIIVERKSKASDEDSGQGKKQGQGQGQEQS